MRNIPRYEDKLMNDMVTRVLEVLNGRDLPDRHKEQQRRELKQKEKYNIKMSSKEKAQKAILDNERGYSKNAGAAGSYDSKGQSWKVGETDKVLYRENKNVRFPNLTKRTNDAITLYMPNTGITAQHTPQWSASEMGGDIGEATGRIQAGMQGGNWSASISGFLEQAAWNGECKF